MSGEAILNIGLLNRRDVLRGLGGYWRGEHKAGREQRKTAGKIACLHRNAFEALTASSSAPP